MQNMDNMSRRQFLRITAICGTAGIAWKLGTGFTRSPEVVSETRILMGTVVNLRVISDNRAHAKGAIAASLDRMQQLEGILSRFQADSQLSRLNNTGQVEQPSPVLVELLEFSHSLSDQSHGAFDITVKPLIDLYAKTHCDTGSLPADDAIADTLALVDYQQVRLHEDRITLAKPGMAITLDGIAKGYIVDQGVAVLRERGLSNVIVEAGGDLLATGYRTESNPWRIGIQSPRPEQTSQLATIRVSDRAVATSGDYMQSYAADHSTHHIIDPRTGYSGRELASATVLAPNTVLADALATTLMVLGTVESLEVIRQFPDCETMLVTKTLDTITTEGFRRLVTE